MDSKFKFTDKAENDLDEILNYISNKLLFQAANDLFNEIFKTIHNIIAFPLSLERCSCRCNQNKW